jgi:hypothetical protein
MRNITNKSFLDTYNALIDRRIDLGIAIGYFSPTLNSQMMNNSYTTKAEAIIDLQERGYDYDFILKNEYIICIQQSETICPDDFEITEAYRFDGAPRMSDNYIIYAVRSLNHDLNGILMASYSTLTKGLSIHLWSKLANNLKFFETTENA